MSNPSAAISSRLASLRLATRSDRTTLRIDDRERDWDVDRTAGESHGPGVRSLAVDNSIDQRRLETVKWLQDNGKTLVQPNFVAPPAPPPALIDLYGVKAQMLEPIFHSGQLIGWVSVHSLVEREWTTLEVATLVQATADVARLLELAD